jgi:tetratricopeptide (TPR) repeat protein
MRVCPLGIFALFAMFPEVGHGATGAPQSKQVAETSAQKANRLVEHARQLIADAIPEERDVAERELIEATRACRTCADAHIELGKLWLTDYSLGRGGTTSLQKAATMAEISSDLEPDNPRSEYLGVELLLTIGRQAEAFRLYKSTVEKYPDHIETLAFDARLWAEVEPKKALAAAQKAIAMGYSLQELSPWIGNAIVKSNSEELSGPALEAFASVYPDRWLWHRAAMAHSSQKNWSAAKSAFEKSITLGNTIESPLQLAILEYKEMGQAKQSAQRLQELLKRIANRPSLSDDAVSLVETHASFAHLAARDFPSAQVHAEKALKLSAVNNARIAQIIDTFRNEKQLALIADGLRRTVLLNPMLEEAHLALAMIATQSENYTATIEHLTSAIALTPDRDDLYSARGQASYLATRYEVALEDFEAAIRQNPEHAPYHYNKACLLSLLGRKDEAYESLKIAVIKNSRLRDHAGTDRDLLNLRLDKEFESRLAQLGIPLENLEPTKAASVSSNSPSTGVSKASQPSSQSQSAGIKIRPIKGE